MLANSINLPLVAFFGLLISVPLTVVVVSIEMLVFWTLFRLRPRQTAKPLLIANILSTVAGWVMYYFQGLVLYLLDIRTLMDFATRYVQGALVLIVLYYTMSIVVEGLFVTRRAPAGTFAVSRCRLWAAVVIANIGSYLLVGPLFYYSTRPTFQGLEFVDHPSKVTTSKQVVYFLSPDTQHLHRINADGSGLETLLPFHVNEYLVSEDQAAFLYRGQDQNLWFCRIRQEPVLIWETDERFNMMQVDLSKNADRVAYATQFLLTVRDTETSELIAEVVLDGDPYRQVSLAWDAVDPNTLHCLVDGSSRLCWRVVEGRLNAVDAIEPAPVGNFRRGSGGRWYSGYSWGVSLPYNQMQGDLTLHVLPTYGRHVRVRRDEKTIAMFHNDYGLLNLGFPGPSQGFFLDQPGLVLCEGSGWLYVLDALNGRVAELAPGHEALTTTEVFQASFGDEQAGPASGGRWSEDRPTAATIPSPG